MLLQLILIVILIYALAGFIFMIPFIVKGITQIDQASEHSSFGFKLIIIPGIIVFWPVLLKKWLNSSKHNVQ